MKVVAHLDPAVLERELLRLVDEAHPRDRPASTLVLVPATRLATHVRGRLTRCRPAWLGLRVVHFRGLALDVLRGAGLPVPQVASDALLEALAGRLVTSSREGIWADRIRRRPGALGRLRRTLDDLRDAGITPGEATAVLCEDEGERDLARIFGAYHEALERLLNAGWTDEPGLVRAAIPHAADHVRPCRTVVVHGAYELIGVNLDLVREIDRGREVTLLLPGGAAGPAGRHALEFARRYLGVEPQSLEPPPRAAALALESLYDEDRRPPAAASGRFAFYHAQGAAAEVRVALREALAAVARGCPPEEIVITARSLEPYAAAIEEAFGEEGLPWTTSLAGPLRRQPLVRDFLLLLEVVATGFPRRTTAELVRSPRVAWDHLVDAPVAGARADAWSREARIIGGLDEWSTLPEWAAAAARRSGADEVAERWRAAARGVVDALTALAARVTLAARPFGEHGRAWRALLDELFELPENAPEEAHASLELLRGLLDDMGRFETLLDETEPVPFVAALDWLGHAVDRSELPATANKSGIRVLDAMQVRGLTCRELHLLGMNAKLFPRPPAEDPCLSDARRRALAERSGRPLPIQAVAAGEERLILGLLLGAASERTAVSWQRADESGRARNPSLALREVARIALGSPDLDPLRTRDEPHVPSHPTDALEWLVRRTGLLSPAEGRLLATLYGQEARAASEIGARFPELEPGLALLRATQSFVTVDEVYDASVGPVAAGAELSVTSCEELGRCPLRWFFARVLRVRVLEEPASAFGLKPNELGSAIHALLQSLYATLEREGAFARPPGERVARALELLRRDEGRILGEAAQRLSRRLPLLWGEELRSWRSTLEAFVADDLERLAAAGRQPVGLERALVGTLDFDGVTQAFTAKLDRELEGGAGPVVGDYKVSRRLAPRVKVTEMLRGEQLQVPLYHGLAGGAAEVEVLGVHPQLDVASGEHRARFAGFAPDDRASFADTMRTLLSFKNEGRFPFQQGRHCDWCGYTQACRRLHPPSRDRQAESPAGIALARLRAKKAVVDAGS